MTECTGKRYWVARIKEAKKRYAEWASKRGPSTILAGAEARRAYIQWMQARCHYFDDCAARWGKQR